MQGIKGKQAGIQTDGAQGDIDTGPSLRITTQDGRNPSSTNIPITNRVDHHRKGMTSMGSSTTASQEVGKVGNGPTFK